ncbi:hypothetical protein BJY59DRAFT_598140 [Rhodotorula toruloides]
MRDGAGGVGENWRSLVEVKRRRKGRLRRSEDKVTCRASRAPLLLLCCLVPFHYCRLQTDVLRSTRFESVARELTLSCFALREFTGPLHRALPPLAIFRLQESPRVHSQSTTLWCSPFPSPIFKTRLDEHLCLERIAAVQPFGSREKAESTRAVSRAP